MILEQAFRGVQHFIVETRANKHRASAACVRVHHCSKVPYSIRKFF
jgi:hypothetical protein